MRLSKEQAEIIIDLLEIATNLNWGVIASDIQDAGHTPRDVIEAWEELADIADRQNVVPDLADF